MANFIRVRDSEVQLHFQCDECDKIEIVAPTFFGDCGNPLCWDCDVEMSYIFTMIDPSVFNRMGFSGELS